jgi:hypothetical protein
VASWGSRNSTSRAHSKWNLGYGSFFLFRELSIPSGDCRLAIRDVRSVGTSASYRRILRSRKPPSADCRHRRLRIRGSVRRAESRSSVGAVSVKDANPVQAERGREGHSSRIERFVSYLERRLVVSVPGVTERVQERSVGKRTSAAPLRATQESPLSQPYKIVKVGLCRIRTARRQESIRQVPHSILPRGWTQAQMTERPLKALAFPVPTCVTLNLRCTLVCLAHENLSAMPRDAPRRSSCVP